MWLMLATTSSFMLAASSTGGLEVYGPLGAAVGALSLFAAKAYKREADRADRLEAQLAEFLPRLLKAAESLEALGATRRAR